MGDLKSQSGIALKAVYTPADAPPDGYAARLADPGQFPFTRGVRPRAGKRTWIQRELSGEGDARRSNAQLKFLLGKGQTGVDVIGDTPTMALMDPDHPYARNAVGTQGVSLCAADDFVALLDGIPLDAVSVSASLPAAFTIAGLHLAAQAHGYDPAVLRGSTVQFVFYGEDCGYATHMPFKLRLRLAADSIAFAARAMPRFHAFLEDTYYISDGGLDAVEEMALGFVEIRYLVRELLARGLEVDAFAPRIAVLLNAHMDFFETVAKVRATRRLFARMMREEFGARDPRSLAVNITSHTSGLALTAQQPVNNVVRGALQALALVMAGVQAVEISTFDEAYRTPSAAAHEVGLRTQQIIDLETNVTLVDDPLGGSYYVEALTDALEARIADLIADIERRGDPAELSDQGYFRSIFVAAMSRHAASIEQGSRPKVGVNVFTVPPCEDTLLRAEAEEKIAPWLDRIAAVEQFKRARPAARVRAALAALHASARDEGENLVPPIRAGFAAGATMGEMAGVLRLAYGAPYDPLGAAPSPLG